MPDVSKGDSSQTIQHFQIQISSLGEEAFGLLESRHIIQAAHQQRRIVHCRDGLTPDGITVATMYQND